MNPKFISGPPGTGKTHKWLKEKYAELLKKYSWDRIVVLSHTNVAAAEIIEAVKKLPELQNVSKEDLEEQICTIHSYCRGLYVHVTKFDKEEVTVNMIVETMAAEFPEFVWSFAEENFLRGYQVGLDDARVFAREPQKSDE